MPAVSVPLRFCVGGPLSQTVSLSAVQPDAVAEIAYERQGKEKNDGFGDFGSHVTARRLTKTLSDAPPMAQA